MNGVTAWLKAHSPPLIGQAGGRLHALPQPRPGPTSVRFHAAALCALRGGQADLGGENAELLADALVLPTQELRLVLEESLAGSDEFHLFGSGVKSISYRGSPDPFLEWIVHGRVTRQLGDVREREKPGRRQLRLRSCRSATPSAAVRPRATLRAPSAITKSWPTNSGSRPGCGS